METRQARALQILKQYFGYDAFRGMQQQVIDALSERRDALCIMPTGAGKSICYQVPALMLPGMTVVVSPLISLMKDQVSALVSAGVPAAFLNSALTEAQCVKMLSRMQEGRYKLVYVAPERLVTATFLNACRSTAISMVAVDEAHCISQWGQDFRPEYLKIRDFIDRLPERPVVGAFTATATPEVEQDILERLALWNPFVVRSSFDRPNLFFSVTQPSDKKSELLQYLRKNPGKSGIIYCSTRKTVESVCETLIQNGFQATRYHAGLSQEERRGNQENFAFDRKPVMVATNAFGMGIDKSNVSFVIHFNMPKNIESYYQEAGRAGRDGSPAECILFFSMEDIVTNQRLIDLPSENPDLTEAELQQIRQADRIRLRKMTEYAETTGCLRSYILSYFGEKSAIEHCGHCSNCLGQFESVDITVSAQQILSCVARTGQRYGMQMIADVLKGSRSERVVRLGLTEQTTYGLMQDYKIADIKTMISALIRQGYLTTGNGEYPVLCLTEQSRAVLNGSKTVIIKKIRHGKDAPDKTKGKTEHSIDFDPAIFELLKKKRNEIAEQEQVPAYIVFSNMTLQHMATLRPNSETEFLQVNGVGLAKMKKYAAEFLPIFGGSASSDNTSPEASEAHENTEDDLPYMYKVIAEGKISAYQSWLPEEDEKLKEEYRQNLTIHQIAQDHARTDGAIRSRLKKLGLI